MNKITKDTLIPVGLVVTIAGLAFNVGKASKEIEVVSSRVSAIEVDRTSKIDQYNTFQREILQRLTRIETAVTKKRD